MTTKNNIDNIDRDMVIYSLTMDEIKDILKCNLSEEEFEKLNTMPEEDFVRAFRTLFYGDEIKDAVLAIASNLF